MKTRREMTMYSLLEFPDLEKRLEKNAAEGWRLKKAGTFFWTYEESEPKQVHYSIVFFPKTNALEPEPSESLVMMREFCEKTGWKLVAEVGQMQVFCNEEANPVPIETEAWIQVKNIHETMKTNIVMVYGILFVNSLLQLAIQVMQFVINPIQWLGAGYNICLVLTWIALGLGCGTEIVNYYVWYQKAKRIADEEQYLYLPKSIKGFRMTYLGIAFASLFFSVLALADYVGNGVGIFIIVWTTMLVGVPLGISRLLKKMKVSAKWNRIIIVMLTIVAAVGMTVAVFVSVAKNIDFIFGRDEEMSLELSDLREVDEENLVESYRRSNSMFLSFEEGYQREKWEEDESVAESLMMDYTILVIKTPFLYDFCKNELLSENDYDEKYPELQGYQGYKKVDMPQWGAIEVYCDHDFENEPENEFIVCYEDRILQIDFGWDVTNEDIAKLRELVKKMK
ncbi:MAG: DUF2812 domain-containing protein [Agathobacter sp.]|nr:DUF2812 domain-containing protein [Agathobacter sp.]